MCWNCVTQSESFHAIRSGGEVNQSDRNSFTKASVRRSSMVILPGIRESSCPCAVSGWLAPRRRARLPGPITVAVVPGETAWAFLAKGRPGQGADLQLHQPFRGEEVNERGARAGSFRYRGRHHSGIQGRHYPVRDGHRRRNRQSMDKTRIRSSAPRDHARSRSHPAKCKTNAMNPRLAEIARKFCTPRACRAPARPSRPTSRTFPPTSLSCRCPNVRNSIHRKTSGGSCVTIASQIGCTNVTMTSLIDLPLPSQFRAVASRGSSRR